MKARLAFNGVSTFKGNVELNKLLIECLSELEKLKYVERGFNVGNRKESTAEHSWSCMLLADILIDFVNEPLDKLKVLEYLLYHDIAEIYAGDAKFNNPEEMQHKQQREEAAHRKICTFHPSASRFNKIIEQYESRNSSEAKFAKAIDCIDACIRSLNDETKSRNDGFTEELIYNRYHPHVSKFAVTDSLFDELLIQLRNADKI